MNYKNDLFKMAKAWVQQAQCFGWADNKRMVQQCATDSMNNTLQVLKLEFFLLLDWLPYQS